MAERDRIPADALADRLIRLYAKAERQLSALLVEAIVSGQMHTANYRLRQLNKVETILASLRKATISLSATIAWGAYTNGVQIVDRSVPDGLSELPEGPRLRSAIFFSTRLQNAALAALASVGRSIDDVFAVVGREQSAIGIAGGLGRREVSAAMRRDLVQHGLTGFTDRAGRRWRLEPYTRMVARTTTREAVSAGAIQRMDELGLDIVEISSHAGPCDECKKYDGKRFSLSGESEEYPELDAMPPFHPNAVIAGTEVQAIGELRGGTRARWSGPLIELATRSGIRLAIGPNHPVLTGRGWLAAKLLREGDHVLRRTNRERVGSAAGASLLRGLRLPDEDLDHVPALAEDVFKALTATGFSTLVPAAPAHLHGDGNFCEGDVDVVGTDGFLEAAGVPPLAQPVQEPALVGADVELAGLAGVRSLDLGLHGVGGPVAGPLPDLNSARAQASSQSGLGEVSALGEVLDRLSGAVTTDEIIEVRDVDHWRGHAFDFETSSQTYFADGLFVHNCRHVLTPAPIFSEIPEVGVGAAA